MSHAYDARFSATTLDLDEIFLRLAACLDESRITFDHQITRLYSRNDAPTVMSLSTESVQDLREVAERARSWFGVSLDALSCPLFEAIGKSDSIEVYLSIFKTRNGRAIKYNENSGALRARAQSDELTRDLAALLVRICTALELELAIYAEEGDDDVVPNLAELERRLAEQGASTRALWWLAVVSSRSMNLARAQELAGPWAHRIRVSTSGYLVLPFLSGDLAA